MPLVLLLIICIVIVLIIAAAFGFAVSKGYEYKHTVDPLPDETLDDNENNQKADT
ncbi:YtzI protein [Halobacillus salinarum]|uniref:YtzI protein n=1 Tax=Halobacillus salinarum TaxID=2932257 RepID=A0ABY4EPT6_9BACI|nr:YtzI protein [Halobacillus salinarum]UOQ45873.1 YtzI protein [Halobacillus salinarum]